MGKHAVDKWQDKTILKEIETIETKSGYIEKGRYIPYTTILNLKKKQIINQLNQ